MELKYFYYISKPKVEMLLAQLHRTRFGLLSFTPRIEFAGLSVAGDLKKRAKQGSSSRHYSIAQSTKETRCYLKGLGGP